jgi:imidazolonepropionase-like amidohydrolase
MTFTRSRYALIMGLLFCMLHVSVSVAAGSHAIFLRNANLIDVVAGRVRDGVDVLIQDDRITYVEQHGVMDFPEGVRVIDLEGRYVIPGLVEGHTHISSLPESSLTIALRRGVTALRDMGGDGAYLREVQTAIEQGELSGPDIYFSALMGGRELIMNDTRVKLSTPPGYALGEAPWARLVEEGSDIPGIIGDARACGATGVKIYAYLDAGLVRRLSDEAKRQGMKVWAHATVYPATAQDVVDAGVEVISHAGGLLYPPDWNLIRDGSLAMDASVLDSGKLERLFEAMKKNDTALDPTLVIGNVIINSVQDEREADRLKELTYSVTGRAHENSIRIVAGTDWALPKTMDERLMLWEEIELLVNEAGLSEMEALRAATLNSADVLGIGETHGSIDVGKIADMVVLRGNPVDDIASIEDVEFVIKNGKIVR